VFAIIIALSFSTDLGSLTTFAGLLGAGIVLCLQNVILAAVGYFVLLGKYRIHTGDRIEIAGVVGNVVDIDLMRLSLMEVGARGTDAEGIPTGRTVDFSNAIVFQPNVGFFKQVPGTNYLWHEIVITLSGRADYRLIEERIMAEVNEVFKAYSDKVEQQHVRMERELNFSIAAPKPQSRLRFTQGGLELIVRYPVTRDNAIEIDDKITRALLQVMEYEPNLKSVGAPISDPTPSSAKVEQAAAAATAAPKPAK
jgi:small-conductance mechanosensitive channel